MERPSVYFSGSKGKLKWVKSFLILFDGTLVDRVESVKYQGVQLNSNLDGSTYISLVLKSCAGCLGFLYCNFRFLDRNRREVQALIQPYIKCCCSLWYAAFAASLK